MHKTLILLFLVLLSGCGPSAELSSLTAKRLQCLATVYLDFAGAKGVGPANEKELIHHIGNIPPTFLQIVDLSESSAAQHFRSERDGESFVVHYGAAVLGQQDLANVPIAYEKNGQDGMLLVVYANGQVKLVEARQVR